MNEEKRIIFHIDMDHFYTAIEQREHPELKGKPVIVGANPKDGKGRGVVSTSNYEARKFGVKSGMPISRAWRLCPEGVFLPVNMDLYVRISGRIMNMLRTYADKFEQWGIDEAFLDVTSRAKSYHEAEALAREIKRKIFESEGLTCSIGISSNKLVSKIASDVQKPDGLTIVADEDIEKFLAPLSVRKLPGVGRKTGQILEDRGVKTIADLAKLDPAVLTESFGVIGIQLHLMAQGTDRSEVEERNEIKSIGRDVTFQEDTDESDYVLKALGALAEEVHSDILNQALLFKTVTVRVRYKNFETHTHSKTLPFLTDRLQDLTKTAADLMQPYFRSGKKFRLVGVRASGLVSSLKQKKLL